MCFLYFVNCFVHEHIILSYDAVRTNRRYYSPYEDYLIKNKKRIKNSTSES